MENKLINKHNLLILDIISKYPENVNKLIYAKDIDIYRNFNLQYFSIQENANAIFDLIFNGLCSIHNYDIDKTEQSIQSYQLYHQFDFHRYDHIALTEKGSQYWEQQYKPNWFNYIDVYYEDKSYTAPVTIELTSMNKSLLQEICKDLNQDKLMIDILDDWEICYWKKVHGVNILKFTYIAETIDEKILIDNIFSRLYSYKSLFCKNSEHFF